MWKEDFYACNAFFRANMHICHFLALILQYKTINSHMKRIITLILLVLSLAQVKAQIFDFGFPDPFSSRQRVQHDPTPVTPPQYKGGNAKINKFIEKNYRNPSERKSVDGQIVVACIIGTKGKVIDAQVVKGLTPELNDEAVRVARHLKFRPARQGKKNIKSRFDVVFPIRHGRLSFLTLNTIEV